MTKEINELSKKTLGSYIHKASYSLDANANDAGYHAAAKDNAEGRGDHDVAKTIGDKEKKNLRKTDKRLNGIEKATNRLTKEDFLPLIHAAASKSAVDFRDVFETLITTKISDLVEGYKEEIAGSLLNEVSKKTLGSYINKAGTDRHNAGYRAAKDPKTLVKNTVRSFKRAVGIEKAVKKLTGDAKIPATDK